MVEEAAHVEVGGYRLEIERIAGDPRRPTLVFLHEGLGCLSRWGAFPRSVAAATGCPALVWSRRGYGRSEPRPGPWPLDFMHHEARAALPALLDALGLDDVILVGHSDGGSIALVHAAEHADHAGHTGRVRAICAIAPHVFVEEKCVVAIAALRDAYVAPTVGDSPVRRGLARHHADVDATFLGWAGAWLDPAFRAWDLRSFLPRVRAPLLLVQGDADEYGTLAQLDAVEAGVASVTERVVLPGCGHIPPRDRPAETLAAIAAFVARA